MGLDRWEVAGATITRVDLGRGWDSAGDRASPGRPRAHHLHGVDNLRGSEGRATHYLEIDLADGTIWRPFSSHDPGSIRRAADETLRVLRVTQPPEAPESP